MPLKAAIKIHINFVKKFPGKFKHNLTIIIIIEIIIQRKDFITTSYETMNVWVANIVSVFFFNFFDDEIFYVRIKYLYILRSNNIL